MNITKAEVNTPGLRTRHFHFHDDGTRRGQLQEGLYRVSLFLSSSVGHMSTTMPPFVLTVVGSVRSHSSPIPVVKPRLTACILMTSHYEDRLAKKGIDSVTGDIESHDVLRTAAATPSTVCWPILVGDRQVLCLCMLSSTVYLALSMIAASAPLPSAELNIKRLAVTIPSMTHHINLATLPSFQLKGRRL